MNPLAEKAFSFVVTELMTIFQISLAMLTFVIATFGFRFAPNYIDNTTSRTSDNRRSGGSP